MLKPGIRAMKALLATAVCASLNALLLAVPASAADFRTGVDPSSGRAFIVLDGDISPGDADKFNQTISSDLYFLANAHGILVNSRGGDVSEAIKIAEIVERAALPIEVSSTGECSSACFFIYMAAPMRTAYGAVRIHAPYYDLKNINANEYTEYAQASRLVQEQTRTFLLARSVPSDIIERMLAVSSTGSFDLTIEERNRIGYESAFVREYGTQMCGGYRTDRLMSMEEIRKYRDCTEMFLVEARLSFAWGEKWRQAREAIGEVGLMFSKRVELSPALSHERKLSIQKDLSQIVTASQPETWVDRFDRYLKAINL